MSNRLMEFRQCQHDLKQEAVALLDVADADDSRDLTMEEEARYNDIEAELKTVGDNIAVEEAKQERRKTIEAIRTAPAQLPITVPASPRNPDDVDPEKTSGFKSIAEFAQAVRTACQPETAHLCDPRLKGLQGGGIQAAPSNYLEGKGSSGEGFELPVAYRADIWQLVFDMNDIMMTVDMEPTTARQVDWTADETTPWGSSGVTASWRAESSQMTASQLATKGRSMTLHELYAHCIATEELLEDAPRLQNRLTVKAAQAINYKVNDAFVNGTGAGQPIGWASGGNAALVTVAKESGQTATTINGTNILKMFSRLLVVPGDRPYWLANMDTVPQLANMTIGDQPVWLPPGGLIQSPGGILMGYPVRFSEHCQTVGTAGDIQLASPKGYYAARRTQGIQFASSMHLYFDYNMQAFRWTFRVGGQPHLSAAVSPARGSATKSHFVSLATRA